MAWRAELHDQHAELWEAFSRQARSNKALAPYWELLAMCSAPQGQDELEAPVDAQAEQAQ